MSSVSAGGRRSMKKSRSAQPKSPIAMTIVTAVHATSSFVVRTIGPVRSAFDPARYLTAK